MAFSQSLSQGFQDQMFRFLQQQQMANERRMGTGGPSATLPNGTHIQCQPGQDLNVTPGGGASCSNPKDTFTPSFPPQPGPILIPPPHIFPR